MIMIRNPLRHTFKSSAALLPALALVCGCGHPVQETAAHKIANVLPSVLGPAAHYDVQVDGDPFALSRGRARAVHIQGQQVQLSPRLTLDTLDADARDVSFNRDTRRLEHIGQTNFTATLGQAHLDAYLAHVKPLLPNLSVTLRSDDVEARVPVTFLGLQTMADLTGTLAPNADEPDKLDFTTNGVHVGMVPLPSALVNLALSLLNPVVDLSSVKVPLTVTNTSILNGQLTISGNVNLNGLTRAQRGI